MRDDQCAQQPECAQQPKGLSPTTVETVLDEQIQHLVEKLHRLIVLKLSIPTVVLRQLANDIRKLAQLL